MTTDFESARTFEAVPENFDIGQSIFLLRSIGCGQLMGNDFSRNRKKSQPAYSPLLQAEEHIMKPIFALALPVSTILLAAILAGCATDPAARPPEHHPEMAAMKGSMDVGSAPAGHGMGMMSDADMNSMCEMHEKMMRATTPEERKAIMAEYMKTMPPQVMRNHMEMMQSEMQMMREHMRTDTPGK